jgi:site-specific DNA recombinase
LCVDQDHVGFVVVPRRAAVYVRISLDRREGEGVARQLADCTTLAGERGWDVVDVYSDNDLSAFRSKRRPEWDRLLSDLAAGVVGAVVAYHPDRFYRRAADLEALIEVVELTGAEVATVKAGDIDLATATGRMGARIVAAVNRHESERIGERVSRAKRERAVEGRPPGGGVRAFGWEADKTTLVPVEAAALRDAAVRVAAGGSIGAEVRRLNEAGFETTGGRPWTVGSLRRCLESPRIAGLRSYRGEVVGRAVWPPIVDEDTWRRIVIMCQARRRGRPPKDRWLLTALIRCPHCGGNMYGNGIAYACHPSTRQGCGGCSVTMEAADRKVTEAIDTYLDDPKVPTWIAQGAKPVDLSAEVGAIEAKKVELAQRWALDEIDTAAYDTARGILERRLSALGELTPPSPQIPSLDRLRGAWKGGSNSVRRGVVQALVDEIRLAPERMADPADRVSVVFKEV